MKKPLLAAMMVVVALGACSTMRQSSLNPATWFGHSRRAAPVQHVAGKAVVVDTRVLIPSVSDMKVERTVGGAIVRATGTAPSQGWYDAALLPENDGNPVKGVLTFRFVARPPAQPYGGPTPQSREVTVGVFVANAKLEGVRQITVTGAQDARSSRR